MAKTLTMKELQAKRAELNKQLADIQKADTIYRQSAVTNSLETVVKNFSGIADEKECKSALDNLARGKVALGTFEDVSGMADNMVRQLEQAKFTDRIDKEFSIGDTKMVFRVMVKPTRKRKNTDTAETTTDATTDTAGTTEK